MRRRGLIEEPLSDTEEPETVAAMDVYTFVHNFETPPSIIYCCASQLPPQPIIDPAQAIAILEATNLSTRFYKVGLKINEEKKSPIQKLTYGSVKAAIKVALKCQSDSKYGQQQGFSENMQSLAYDMGRLNTIKYILPKIPMILVYQAEISRIKSMKNYK